MDTDGQMVNITSRANVLPMLIAPSSSVNVESESSELMGKTVSSLEEAYDLYNEYSYKIGFGIRKSRNRMKADKTLGLRGKEFCCCKAGFKKDRGKDSKYTKTDSRTGCRAMVYFEFDSRNDVWTVAEHLMEHNHPFVPAHQRHLIKSHKRLNDKELDILKVLRSSGFNVADGMRLLTKEVDRSPTFSSDANNGHNGSLLDKKKFLDGMYANTFLEIFMNRLKDDKDFFYSFEVDNETGTLLSVFWRDGRMKQDYRHFGDLVMFEMIYCTEKCDLLCAPFIGLNNHTQPVMFGCGFIFNERVESFKWLFKRFLDSMNNVVPDTIMTDHSDDMVDVVRDVFSHVQHRFGTWHIEESSKKHIESLRSKPNFVVMFERCLSKCESVAEFEHFWQRLLVEHDCSENLWLQNLHDVRSQWCPPYFKNGFSGGVLATQRSESAYNSIQKKMCFATDLVDLYGRFCDVVTKWRSIDKENEKCMPSMPETSFQDVGLISHAFEVYTFEVFKLFEAEFKRILSYQQLLLSSTNGEMTYKVWTGCESFHHIVVFNILNHEVKCTCNKFKSCGLLCCHCLRIYNIHNVQRIPNRYILKRWTKQAVDDICDGDGDGDGCVDRSSTRNSVWCLQMKRKFDSLISLSDLTERTRAYMEEMYEEAKVFLEARPISRENCLASICSSEQVSTPQSNKRKIGEVEKLTCNERGRIGINGRQERETINELVKEEMVSEPMFFHPSEGALHVVIDPQAHEGDFQALSAPLLSDVEIE